MGTEVTLTANTPLPDQVFDGWEVVSGNITLANSTSTTTTFTMPASDVSVKSTYLDVISSVEITGIDAPVSNTTLDTTAACATTGVSTTTPTVTWTPSDANAQYGTIYTASVRLSAGEGYKFADFLDSVTVNGNPVTSADQNDDGTLTVTYTFPATDTGSGGGSSTPTYKVESDVSEDTDGSISFSKSSARKGDTVTITVTPDRYYKVDSVTVKDKNGKEIAVTDNGDGTFTFKMPASKVSVVPVFSWDNPFTDVAENAFYAPAVKWALINDITNGTDDGTTFSPDADCTRGEIVTFLWKSYGCPEPLGMSSFTDVSDDAYYAKAVAWAVEKGITSGTGDGKFSPDVVCTRGQIVTLIYRSEQAQGGGMQGEWMFQNPFADVSLEDYYGEAVMWAVANSVTSGTSDTTFSPNDNCTRGQIVTFLYRFFVK